MTPKKYSSSKSELTGIVLACLLGVGLEPATLLAQSASIRPPAVPLVTHNPYFSLWSMSDHLTDENTKHWTGTPQPLIGLVRIDGHPYRFMGILSENGAESPLSAVPAMEQISVDVSPTHTTYTFEAEQVRLVLSFFTASLPMDLDVLSRPVTYLTFTASAEGAHDVSILLDADPMFSVDNESEEVTWSRARASGLTILNVGSRDQRVLSRSGDNLRIDWGYLRLGIPDAAATRSVLSHEAILTFVKNGGLPASDDLDMPRAPSSMGQAAHLAVALPLGKVSASPISRHVLLAYTEDYAIEYLGRKLHPYWQRNGKTVEQMLAEAESSYSSLENRGRRFDEELTTDLKRVGGAAYAQLATLAYRQTLAANGLVADIDGTPLLFPKENFSCGCISTVDVIYPAAPFFLFFNPALIKAQLKPVLDYAALPLWKFPFAPHDLGFYPLANGAIAMSVPEGEQMPVEESGNMLILAAAMAHETGDWDFIRKYWSLFTTWAEFLRAKGLDPENQLCTDDFTGHLAHNANLSIKAIESLASYAQLAQGVGKGNIARDYQHVAAEMATRWQTMAFDGNHYKLAFDKPGTWSQKYNLVWDKVLSLNLFPDKVRQTEMKYYLTHLSKYGLALDNRADYTKLDWELWTATLGDASQFAALLSPISKWVNEGRTRVPLTDYYDAKTSDQVYFQARSVVGGIFIKALSNELIAQRWWSNSSQTGRPPSGYRGRGAH